MQGVMLVAAAQYCVQPCFKVTSSLELFVEANLLSLQKMAQATVFLPAALQRNGCIADAGCWAKCLHCHMLVPAAQYWCVVLCYIKQQPRALVLVTLFICYRRCLSKSVLAAVLNCAAHC
jgi:hypothetical protein